MSNLKHIREQIDVLDHELLELLAVRFALAEQAKQYKDEVTDLGREEQLKGLWHEWSEELGISIPFCDALREMIMAEAKRLQEVA